jgi:hypothetical protein
MSNKYLWKFNFECGRMGELHGLFVATEEEANNVIGQEAYFGEVLGKHSEIYGTIDRGEIQKVDLDAETVEKVAKILGETWSGYNPLHYIKYECPICDFSCNYEEFNKKANMCWDCYEKQEKK